MRCKRCGCTEDRPCVQEINGESVECSWAAPAICTGCLTTDEQLIVASLMEQEGRTPTLTEQRAHLQRGLFPQFLKARINVILEPLTDATKHLAIEEAWSVAGLAVERMLPEPARIVPASADVLDRIVSER